MRNLLVVLLMASAAACGGTTTTVRTVDSYHPRTWVGASVPDVEAVWGPAKTGESDGLGGRIISYRGGSGLKVTVSAPETLPNPGEDSDMTGKPDRDLATEAMAPQQNAEPQVDAKFWVDAAGKVYRYWFSEQVWKKTPEKAAPPASPVNGETDKS